MIVLRTEVVYAAHWHDSARDLYDNLSVDLEKSLSRSMKSMYAATLAE